MVNSGDIVYFDQLIFRNNQVDTKKMRPCIVLNVDETSEQVICVPLTSQIKAFNKYNYKYCLVPVVIYDYYKMNFVSLENLMVRDCSDVHETGIHVDAFIVDRIIDKLKQVPNVCDKQVLLRLIDSQVTVKQEKNEEESDHKQLRKLMRSERK